MDDYKRTIYLAALRKLKERPGLGVCTALDIILHEEGYNPIKYQSGSEKVKELFPEFSRLQDGKEWGREGQYCIAIFEWFWWELDWVEPRIRTLNTLLYE